MIFFHAVNIYWGKQLFFGKVVLIPFEATRKNVLTRKGITQRFHVLKLFVICSSVESIKAECKFTKEYIATMRLINYIPIQILQDYNYIG